MKALTIHQPWASLISVGVKHFETRGWPTKYRGPIAIHAGMKPVHKILREMFTLGQWDYHPHSKEQKAFLSAVGKHVDVDGLAYGAIVATADLVGCWHTYGRAEIVSCGDSRGSHPGRINHFVSDDELLFGDFTAGRFAFELENIKPMPQPIPVKGKQGIWNWEGKR